MYFNGLWLAKCISVRDKDHTRYGKDHCKQTVFIKLHMLHGILVMLHSFDSLIKKFPYLIRIKYLMLNVLPTFKNQVFTNLN